MLCGPSRAECTSGGDPHGVGTGFNVTVIPWWSFPTNSLLIMLKTAGAEQKVLAKATDARSYLNEKKKWKQRRELVLLKVSPRRSWESHFSVLLGIALPF